MDTKVASQKGLCQCDMALYDTDCDRITYDDEEEDLRCDCFKCPTGSALGTSYSCNKVIAADCKSFDCSGTCNGEYLPPLLEKISTTLPTTLPTQAAVVATTNPPTNTTEEPTTALTENPTQAPTDPTAVPTTAVVPTAVPTQDPTATPTLEPSVTPTQEPTADPTQAPTQAPTVSPTQTPTNNPTTSSPSLPPTKQQNVIIINPDPTTENKGLTRSACSKVGNGSCCGWNDDDGECFSAIGQNKCPGTSRELMNGEEACENKGLTRSV
eukprot:CAMPEP_0170804240 /NCGR_PEP_ID=MMETSP0733-20121128/30576_1 /TAXON_ID=186038 /ORGANISM="Fragilariopsis kerguelensis, Strain L26-C5" /LENGTH=268 /DNA_ID=CAMNT_0011158231 /DNA_START=213 /DNA_END=1016 /DNA_ORIENTATION=+